MNWKQRMPSIAVELILETDHKISTEWSVIPRWWTKRISQMLELAMYSKSPMKSQRANSGGFVLPYFLQFDSFDMQFVGVSTLEESGCRCSTNSLWTSLHCPTVSISLRKCGSPYFINRIDSLLHRRSVTDYEMPMALEFAVISSIRNIRRQSSHRQQWSHCHFRWCYMPPLRCRMLMIPEMSSICRFETVFMNEPYLAVIHYRDTLWSKELENPRMDGIFWSMLNAKCIIRFVEFVMNSLFAFCWICSKMQLNADILSEDSTSKIFEVIRAGKLLATHNLKISVHFRTVLVVIY